MILTIWWESPSVLEDNRKDNPSGRSKKQNQKKKKKSRTIFFNQWEFQTQTSRYPTAWHRGKSRLPSGRPIRLDWETYFNPAAHLAAEHRKERLLQIWAHVFRNICKSSPCTSAHVSTPLPYGRRKEPHRHSNIWEALETKRGQDLGRGAPRTSLWCGQGIRDGKDQVLGLRKHCGKKQPTLSNVCMNIKADSSRQQ